CILASTVQHKLSVISSFFFNDAATTEIYTLSLHDALPILKEKAKLLKEELGDKTVILSVDRLDYSKGILHRLNGFVQFLQNHPRSEEHTSELQSRENLVCRLLLEKKKIKNKVRNMTAILNT